MLPWFLHVQYQKPSNDAMVFTQTTSKALEESHGFHTYSIYNPKEC